MLGLLPYLRPCGQRCHATVADFDQAEGDIIELSNPARITQKLVEIANGTDLPTVLRLIGTGDWLDDALVVRFPTGGDRDAVFTLLRVGKIPPDDAVS